MATGTQDELTRLKIHIAELEASLANLTDELDEARTELEQQRLEMDALHQFDREMTRSEDIDFIMEYVGTWAVMRTRSDYGVIARWDTHRGCFEVLQATGIPLEMDYRPGDILNLPEELTPVENMDKRTTGVMFNASQTHMVSELRHADGRLMGVMLLQRHNEFKFTEADKKFLRSIADRLANSMHMAVLLRRVQDLNQHRSQLFRMLSHDLRQPLTVLMGYIQLIQHAFKSGDPTMVEGYINHVANGAQDLKDLLEEVLLMERIADSTRDDWKTVSLRKAVEQALKKHAAQAELAEHQVEIELPDDDALCKGLSLELQEAAGNILSNAIKYTPKGGHIQVALWREDSAWYFHVIDNGYGIDKERQKRLFESFYRAQQPGTENIKGTGLGLNLVKTIVQHHDGNIFFESEPGQGSTFGFWIPAEE